MLSFVRYSDGPRPLIRELPALNYSGRRLNGLREAGLLGGELHTLGYYAINVCVGSPPRPYNLIVDTGSSVTALPCASCTQCGTHVCGQRGRFDTQQSKTARYVGCSTPGVRCAPCSGSKCMYSVHYTEGSSIAGVVVEDVVQFAHARDHVEGDPSTPPNRTAAVKSFFGCQTKETGMFYRQQADGILGVQRSSTGRMPTLLTSLVAAEKAPNSFSLCLTDTSGLFLMGGSLSAERKAELARTRGAITVPFVAGSRAAYTVRLSAINLCTAGPYCDRDASDKRFARLFPPGAGAPTTTSSSSRSRSSYTPQQTELHPTIIDSGTTFVYASTPVWKAIVEAVKKGLTTAVPSWRPASGQGGKVCLPLTADALNKLPRLQFVLDDDTIKEDDPIRTPSTTKKLLLIKPQQYMVWYPRKDGGVYCIGVYDNQHGGTVIGASIMREREVVFDLQARSGRGEVTFVDAKCAELRAGSAAMQGGYALAGCPAVPKSGGLSSFIGRRAQSHSPRNISAGAAAALRAQLQAHRARSSAPKSGWMDGIARLGKQAIG